MSHIVAPIAQLVEHRTLNPQVLGSSPSGGTRVEQKQPRYFSVAFVLESKLLCFRALVPAVAVPEKKLYS